LVRACPNERCTVDSHVKCVARERAPAPLLHALSKDATLARPNLIVKLAKKAEPDETMDAPAFGKVMCMDSEVDLVVTEANEPVHTDHVTLFATNCRPHHRALFSKPRAVAKLIENVRNHDGLGSARVQNERKLLFSSGVGTPDASTDDDEVAVWVESCDFHGRM
jgi:hypothetical protein